MPPFKSGMVVVGNDFCGRKREIGSLKEHISGCDRVCLIGERRIGKTSLVYETVRRMRGYSLIFIDLLGVRTSDRVSRRILNGIFRSSKKSMLTKLAGHFAALRPVLGLDPSTNTPTLSLSPATAPAPETLEDAIQYVGQQKKTVVFFDEFQALYNLPAETQESVIARLRSQIQLQAETPYIFAGSLRSEMDRLFFNHSSPFYKSALRVELGPLRREEFEEFLRNGFASGKRSIEDELLSLLFKRCHDVPGDIQRLCKCLWVESQPGDRLTAGMLNKALQHLFCDEERAYTILLENVSRQQLECLCALAEVGGSASMGGEFLRLTGIPNNSSVQRALNSLVKKGILFRIGKLYRFTDPFFGEWIRARGL
ncbi:MAG: ATP-binding protein [Planctomycetota bacterium]|nr:ATP-binding protein [Planctomycetota bacterium]MDP7249999.1 ATP-binding protein [Planctomycetota bacterium]